MTLLSNNLKLDLHQITLFPVHFILASFRHQTSGWSFNFNPLAYITERRDQRLFFQMRSATYTHDYNGSPFIVQWLSNLVFNQNITLRTSIRMECQWSVVTWKDGPWGAGIIKICSSVRNSGWSSDWERLEEIYQILLKATLLLFWSWF